MITDAPVQAPSTGIRRLADLVGAACRAPMNEMPERMSAALAGVAGDDENEDFVPISARQPDPLRYARHVLHTDPMGRFTIVSLVWGPGQFSPVHGHHTWCAYAVCDGELHETGYAYDAASRLAVPQQGVTLRAGAIKFAYAGIDQIHKLGNGCDNVARSIHIYGVDAERIATHVNRVVAVGPQHRL